MKKKILLGLCTLMSAYYTHAQYGFATPVGITTVNTSVSPATINLTTIPSHPGADRAGAIWNYNTIDFNSSFTIDFYTNIDTAYGDGADGYCLVFKQNPSLTSMGDPAGYLGYYNGPDFLTNTFGIEFDDFNNNGAIGDPLPYFDHIAITQNGSYTTINTISSPVSILPSAGTIHDNSFHHYTVEWICRGSTLNIYVDGNKRVTTTKDYRALFSNPGAVTWGFTAGIGTSGSNHIVKNVSLKAGAVCALDCKYDPSLMTSTLVSGATQFDLTPNTNNVLVAGYQWDFGDGTGKVITTTPSIIHGYTTSSTYSVTIKILGYNLTTAECCYYTYTTKVKVDGVGGDGGFGKKSANTDNSSKVLTDMSISPNPADSKIDIAATAFKFNTVRIINLNGNKMMELSFQATANKTIDLQALSAGMYIVQLVDEKGEVHTQKINVQR